MNRLAPARRPLKIFAFDPTLGTAARNRIGIDIENESLAPGPVGSRIEVVDFDGANRLLYEPVDLDAPDILMRGGLDPAESDPAFHQQMVYAVAMKVIENFETALGRRWYFTGRRPLRLYPHAFVGRNAAYHPDLQAILFGYFRANLENVGRNLPGQTVFSCLSHDIVAHEMTHAMIDRMRAHYLEPTNPDVLAFHEGFADIVAILQHFTFPDVLAGYVASTRGDLRTRTPLVELASQFGFTIGVGEALRTALDPGGAPDPTLYTTSLEPHDRGRLLVAAVFDSFLTTYAARIRTLTRIASGGSGILPPGQLHPDLVAAYADDAARTATNVLRMAIRAFEYLPPVDITYGDYLRSLVTADLELVPDDPLEQRNSLIEAFRARGILPAGVTSLAAEALVWPTRTVSAPLPHQSVVDELEAGARAFDTAVATPRSVLGITPPAIAAFAAAHAEELDLDPERKVAVQGFHATHRLTRESQLRVDVVLQVTQTADQNEFGELGGVPFRGGTTIVASSDGVVRYIIGKPLPYRTPRPSDPRHQEGLRRLEALRLMLGGVDRTDGRTLYAPESWYKRRLIAQASLARLHDAAPTSADS